MFFSKFGENSPPIKKNNEHLGCHFSFWGQIFALLQPEKYDFNT
jgi:hypothetical protein